MHHPLFFDQRMSKIIETQDIHHQSLVQINDAVGRRSLSHNLAGSWLLRIPPKPYRNTITLNRMIRNQDYSNCFNLGIFVGVVAPSMMAGGTIGLATV